MLDSQRYHLNLYLIKNCKTVVSFLDCVLNSDNFLLVSKAEMRKSHQRETNIKNNNLIKEET